MIDSSDDSDYVPIGITEHSLSPPVWRIINGQPSLKELLKPEAIKDKMLEIMNNSPDGMTLNRGAFRLFLAVDELVSLGGMFEDGEVYGDDY